MKRWQWLSGGGLLAVSALCLALSHAAPKADKKDCAPGQEGKSRLRIEAETTLYALEDRRMEAEGMTVTLSPCGQDPAILTSPKGVYLEAEGQLALSGPVILRSGTLALTASAAVMDTRKTNVALSGPLKIRRQNKGEEPIFVEAASAVLDQDGRALNLKGPLHLWGDGMDVKADRATADLDKGDYTLCCQVTLKQDAHVFKGKTFTYKEKNRVVSTKDTFTMVYKTEDWPGSEKKAGKGQGVVPPLQLDIKTVTLTGKGLTYEGKAGTARAHSAVTLDFGKDNGGGKVGSLRADLNKQTLTMGDVIALTLGQVGLTAKEGVLDQQKGVLILTGDITIDDDTQGQDRHLKAKKAVVAFHKEGAVITLTGGVSMDLLVDTEKLSGSVNL